MLPRPPSTLQSPRRCGVGIDTSRSGHYAVFLQDDLQPAADELAFAESAAGRSALDFLSQLLEGQPVALAMPT
jgi:hypothetical protein